MYGDRLWYGNILLKIREKRNIKGRKEKT